MSPQLPRENPEAVERVARAIANEFSYGFVFDWTERLTGSPATEEMYDRNYWRRIARKALQAADLVAIEDLAR